GEKSLAVGHIPGFQIDPKTVRRTVCCGSVAAAALSSPKTEIIRTCLSPRTGSDHSSLVRVFL
ncbi:hypothetical protein, partial [Neglectibacter timonensis]|uniref:hypothetical protein n=1 Tax=Neglectibacter timonensis TaxID=1776382 RepID=UPI00266BE903